MSLALLTPQFAGCSYQEPVRVYSVPEADRVARFDPQSSPPQEELEQRRILGAIVPDAAQGQSWFFKLSGTAEVVEASGNDFREIVESVRFDDAGDPTWKLPTGWIDERRAGMTFAVWQNLDQDVTATITRLGGGSTSDPETWEEWVLANVNRWRGQLDLPPQDWEGLQPSLELLEELSDEPIKAYYVSIEGTGSGTMRGPFQAAMDRARPSPSPNPNPSASEPQDTSKDQPAPPPARPKTKADLLSYELPEGWSESQESNQFRLATFEIGEDSDSKVVLSEASGSDEQIVQLWLGQVQEEVTDEAVKEIIENAEKRDVNEVGSRVFLIQKEEAILVAAIPWADSGSLFVKLVGSAEAIDQHRDSFHQFLDSLTWREPSGDE